MLLNKLHAVVVHRGNSLWSGQYTAYVLREAGSSPQWYHINDDHVGQVRVGLRQGVCACKRGVVRVAAQRAMVLVWWVWNAWQRCRDVYGAVPRVQVGQTAATRQAGAYLLVYSRVK